MLGFNAGFKAIEQFQAYWLLQSQANHVLHVAPTGFRKTLPVQLAAFNLPPDSVIVMILPYRILFDQTHGSMEAHSIPYTQWSHSQPIPHQTQVVGIPLESLCEPSLSTSLHNLNDTSWLFAIVIDKASRFMEDSGWCKAYSKGAPTLLSVKMSLCI
jgi:hypothetical protein